MAPKGLEPPGEEQGPRQSRDGMLARAPLSWVTSVTLERPLCSIATKGLFVWSFSLNETETIQGEAIGKMQCF